MKIRIYPGFLLLVSFLLLYSCQNEFLDIAEENDQTQYIPGKKLENPYSLKNMRKAQSELNARAGSPYGQGMIEATHLYVRFKPKDKGEYLLLKEKLGLELFSYPLDREVTEMMTDYREPDVAAENITWQYTRVPADFSFADIEYEVLEELYMPWIEDRTETARSGYVDKRSEFQTLIDEAFALTGHSKKEKIQARNGDFNVAVPVFVNAWDDELQGYVPVKGVKVKLTGFTEWGTAYTDGSGFALFNGKAISTAHRIDISWEDAKDWYIFSESDSSIVASTTGPYVNYSGMYYINIGKENPSLFYASIHRALYNFYNNSFGIRYPSLPYYYLTHQDELNLEDIEDNSWMQRRFHVLASPGAGTGTVTSNKSVPAPDVVNISHIEISRYQKNTLDEHSTTNWFAMTTHETAHFAHICHYDISAADQGVMESWARAVEVTLTNEEIRRLTGNNSFKHNEDYQNMNIAGNRDFFILGYTPVFIDCMDSYNQREKGMAYPMDRVSGYTLRQIESCLDGAHSIYDIKAGLKQKYSNPTFQYLDELFSFYEGIDFYLY